MGDVDVENVLLRFPPCLRQNIKEIWGCGKLGLLEMDICIVPLQNQQIIQGYENIIHCNNFILKIPFAGKHLEWEVIFDEEDYEFAPDFNFHDNGFLADPTVDEIIDNIPSLKTWNLKNSKSLVSVVQEFLTYYKKFQIERLKEEAVLEKINEEYEHLKSKGISENSLEVFIDNNLGVIFLIMFTVDVSSISDIEPPLPEQNDNKPLSTGEEVIILKVYFPKPEGSRVITHLHPSPWINNIMKGPPKLDIPAYDRDVKLGDYIETVKDLLTERMKNIKNHYKLKNDYISTLVSLRGLSMVEYDNVKFTKAAFLLEVEDFLCLVCITIGPKFPAEKPTVTLRSVINLHCNKPFFHQLTSYPYSPRWKVEEMINRLLNELLTVAVPKFKADSLALKQC